MNAGQLSGWVSASDRRGVAILAGSVALHLVVLTLIGLDLVARTDGPVIRDSPVFLDLEPWPAFAVPVRPARSPAVASDDASPASSAPLPSLPTLRRPAQVRPEAPPLSATPPASEAPGPAAPVPGVPARSRADAVGGAITLPNAWGGDVCRNPTNFAAWQAARCGERGPAARAETRSARDAEAAIGGRRGDASERRREEAFARQKAMNERWLEYYRYRDAPYPGLRSLPSQL